MKEVEKIIFLKFKDSYPLVPLILQDILDGVGTGEISDKYGVPKQTIRNIKQRYKRYLNG